MRARPSARCRASQHPRRAARHQRGRPNGDPAHRLAPGALAARGGAPAGQPPARPGAAVPQWRSDSSRRRARSSTTWGCRRHLCHSARHASRRRSPGTADPRAHLAGGPAEVSPGIVTSKSSGSAEPRSLGCGPRASSAPGRAAPGSAREPRERAREGCALQRAQAPDPRCPRQAVVMKAAAQVLRALVGRDDDGAPLDLALVDSLHD